MWRNSTDTVSFFLIDSKSPATGLSYSPSILEKNIRLESDVCWNSRPLCVYSNVNAVSEKVVSDHFDVNFFVSNESSPSDDVDTLNVTGTNDLRRPTKSETFTIDDHDEFLMKKYEVGTKKERMRHEIIDELLTENERIVRQLDTNSRTNLTMSETPFFEDLTKLRDEGSRRRKDDCDGPGEFESFVIPALPAGRVLVVSIYSTWGDEHYVGLNGIDIFDDVGNPAAVKKVRCLRMKHFNWNFEELLILKWRWNLPFRT